jgi:Ca-activated chloride channel family protein
MRTRLTHLLTPFLLVGTLALAACNDDSPQAGDRPDVDARSYYEDYHSPDEDADSAGGTAYGAPPQAGAPPAGAPPAAAAPRERSDGYSTATPPAPDWPAPDEDNVFVDSGDSVFVPAADDAESTFALDVDTGSFHTGRAQLDSGMLPDPASIRVEEWVNAFDYGDPAPAKGALGVVTETAAAPHTDDGTLLTRIGISTTELGKRPPAAITFVVDTSGSMDIRERLGLVKASLALLVNHLRADDTVAIVTYGDDARPVLAPTPVRRTEKILAAIDELVPSGSTNMEAGLLLGYEQAREAFRPDAVNAVILASDGVANVGVTDADVLTEQITQAGEEGIHLVTVGYGMGNYNDHLMEQLADQGDGFYRYVDTFEQAEDLFVRDLTPTLTVVAAEAKAQVRFDPEVVESYRLIGYENRQLDDADFTDDSVDAGELGAGHAVTALYEVRPVASADVKTLGEVRLRWTVPATGKTEELSKPISAVPVQSPSKALRLAATVAGFAEVLRGNADVGARGITLATVAKDAAALADDEVPGADELADLVDTAVEVQREED